MDIGAPPSRVPVWVEPVHGYRTPMCQAVAVAGAHVYEWASAHPDSFPPIIINITDGMVTDSPYEGATLDEWAQRLTNIQTSDGPALFFNIFLSPMASNGVLFPATDYGLPEPGPQLFRISSPLPPPMTANAQSTGTMVEPGARGFGFNADARMLVRFLEVGTKWLDEAIKVNRATWPVLTMDWIDGRTLNEYVDFLVTSSNTAALTTLAAKWRALVALLQDSEFAHGDLQHGNVMVDQEGRLRLVDFDGVWIPPLAGQSPPTEFGHPNYQHPLQHVWDRWLDTFSALVIYLSLVALGKEPSLWLALYNSKNLLFAKSDFFRPFKTEAWKQLAAMGDPQVDELVRRLQECCDPDWVSTKSLEMTLDQQAVTPARQPIPAEQRWWEKKPVAVPGSAVPGSAADGPASRPRPQGTPSAVPPASPATPAAATHAGTIRVSAARVGHETAAGTGRRCYRAGPRDRAPDHRRRRPRVHHRDRRSGRRRLGHVAARHRNRDRDREQHQTAWPDVTPPT